ncbi:2-hydroxyacid dehydrogenase [Bacillus sp. Marseille-Q3570]|uniref:2-hydroxyacid dehydrogenase n=1 Tax=Bacillus sp. Marseille-Q3570 TaxID=2963522 RepID=UPI0021B6E767|nr:2-hydroxyacid dehydrogenase [Bacillus sp. Marseille-Q3570]
MKKILYFDDTFDEFKDILLTHTPTGFDLIFWEELTEKEREEQLPKTDYLLVATKKIGEEILSKAKKAKLIQKTGVGMDNIDLPVAAHHKLPACNTPGANSTGVAELTILLILALYRKLPLINMETKNGNWLMWELRPSSYEMEGKTHGFIGFGNIGREAAKRSKAFGTNIIYYDKFRATSEQEQQLEAKYLPMEEVLRRSDIISLHIPLLPETKGLIGETELNLMKDNAVLINVSRGGIVQEGALYDALVEHRIAGAALDVWENEPINPENPLLALENLIASPHIGAGTRDTLNRVLHMAFQNIKRVDEGGLPQFVMNNVKKARFDESTVI